MTTVTRTIVTGLFTLSAGDVCSSAGVKRGSVFEFPMVVSGPAAACLPRATARVTIRSSGPVEVMTVLVSGLPPKTDFDFFVIQVPKTPFGMSWYQGDIETDAQGNGFETF